MIALPFLNWPRLTPKLARAELLAGLSVGLVAVPQAVAYAGLAGMPVVLGIYASFLPTLIATLLSPAPRVSVGPAALSCLLVYASLAGLAEPGSAQWVTLAVWLSILSGGIQIALGLGRFGWVMQLVSAPVLMGFTQAAAVLIIASQLPALLGSANSLLALVHTAAFSVFGWQGAAALVDPRAAAFGLGALAMLYAGKRYAPNFPMVMAVLVLAGGISAVTGFGSAGGRVIGALPAGLPSFALPSLIPLHTLLDLIVPAMVIALVTFLEVAASAKIDTQRSRTLWNENQDLLAHGLGKWVSALSGSFPTSASFSRSALNLYAGAQSGWAAVFTVAGVLGVLLFLTPALAFVPSAILSAIVIIAVSGLLKPRQFGYLWKFARIEALTAALTFIVSLLAAPQIYWGVLAGVLACLSHFLYQRLHPRIIEVGLHADGSLRDRHLWALPTLGQHTFALRMDDAVDFATATALERHIVQFLATHPATAHVCLFALPINRIDATGVEVFGQLCRTLAEREIVLHISGMKLPVQTMLQNAGELRESPWLRLYRTDTEAVLTLKNI